MLFDTHAHMNDAAFDRDRQALIEEFTASGVSLVMNAGCSLESSREGIRLAKENPGFYAAVGSHPDAADEVNPQTLDCYRQMCREEKVKAIGEIGLDYYYEDIPRHLQKQAFRMQLELAQELDMPVIIHLRDAWQDCMDILQDYPKVTGVFHCFSGSAEMAQQLVKKGWYIGFTGVLTFKNGRRAAEAAQAIPLEHIVLETDCPYMAPEPFRGRRNHPGYLYRMAERLAELKGISPEQAAQTTLENGKRLYRI